METFKKIENSNGYEIGNKGTILQNGKIRKPLKLRTGHWIVPIKINNINTNRYIHRLMAEYFMTGFSDDKVVMFKDMNKDNLTLENLYITTKQHSTRLNFISKSVEKAPKAIKVWRKNDMSFVGIFISTYEAAKKLNVKQPNITACLKGRHHSSKGYIFEYASPEHNKNLLEHIKI